MPYRPVPAIQLRAWRLYRNLSQRTLAELTGIDPGQISRFESGKVRPYPSSLAKLAEALGCEPHQLLKVPEPLADVEGVGNAPRA